MDRLKLNRYVLGLVLVAIALNGYGFACEKTTKVRQLAKVEDDVGQGLLSVATVIRDSKANGTLSQNDVDFLKPLLKEVGEGNKRAIAISKSLNSLEDIPQNKQQELIQVISFISDTLTTLNNEGGLRIHDPNKRLVFNSLVLALQTSVTSVIAILNLGGKK